MNEHRRSDDSLFSKLLSLWPIILSILSIIYFAAKVQGKVEDHEFRIARLEASMDKVLDNTQILVDRLVRKKRDE